MASIFEQMQQTYKQNPSAGYFYKPRTSTPVSNPTPRTAGSPLTPGYKGEISTGDHTSLAGLGPEPLKTSPMGDGFVQALKRINPDAGYQVGAQNWINDPRSGHGGIDAYTKKQQDSYKQALAAGNTDLVNRLTADAKRVGYSLDGSVADTTVATEPLPEPKPPEADYSWITDMVNNELASQKSSIEQELARLKQSSELAVNQNNTFLQDQMKNLEENRVKVGNDIVNFQNRRGGFYSGGLDFQTAHNNDVFAAEEGKTTRDIAARNADIWGRNELLAQQASENLFKLQQQAPDRIRQLIEEQKAKDAGLAIQKAGLTGDYMGARTLAGQEHDWARDPNNPNNQAQILTNEINKLKLSNLPQEIKLGLQQLEDDVATGALNRQEAEIKLKELKDPNSITNKSRSLALEADRLGNIELKKRIEQIGLKPAVTASEQRLKEIGLEKAEIELGQLKNGGGGKTQTFDSMRTTFDAIAQRDKDTGQVINPDSVEMSILASNISEYEKYRAYLGYGLKWDGPVPQPGK